MPDLTAKRTLVKSPPELWEELSEVERLAKHLGAFGEITITKLEPEHTVAWEGEHASGTVSIEPSGWGTRVTLHAELPDEAAIAEPEPEPEPDPEPEPEPEPEPVEQHEEREAEEPARRGFWGWLFRTRTQSAAPMPEPPTIEPEPAAIEPEPAAESVEASCPELGDQASGRTLPAEPEPEAARPEPPEGAPLDSERARVVLDEALDALGAAHHRPFSRG